MINNLENFINFYLNKKFNFVESIDLNIIFENKKKNFFFFDVNLIHSINEKKNFLLLTKETGNNDNYFYGYDYFIKFKNKEIFFNKIYYKINYIYLLKENKKIFKKKNIFTDLKKKINELNNKNIKIIINKKNYLNIKIGNINFSENMIKKNYFFLLYNIKKNFFKNKINITKIFISTTMSKSYLIK